MPLHEDFLRPTSFEPTRNKALPHSILDMICFDRPASINNACVLRTSPKYATNNPLVLLSCNAPSYDPPTRSEKLCRRMGVTNPSRQDLVGRETDNYRWTPLYALVIMLWGALFQKYWKRTCAEW